MCEKRKQKYCDQENQRYQRRTIFGKSGPGAPDTAWALVRGGAVVRVLACRCGAFCHGVSFRHRVATSHPNPRVQKGVQNIDRQVHQDEGEGNDENRRLDHRHVTGHNRVVELIAEARPGKNDFSEEGAA